MEIVRWWLLDYSPFLCYSGFGWESIKDISLGPVGAFMCEDWAFNPPTFAEDLFSDDFVSDFFAYQPTFPSSQSSFNALTVKFKSSLRSLAMSKVSASL